MGRLVVGTDRAGADAHRPPLLPDRARPALLTLLAIGGASVVLGGLTSFGQTWLPAAINSLANSPSGWVALVVLLVWGSRRSAILLVAVGGVLAFTGLTLGYQLVSTARGYVYSGEFWFAVGVLVGPFVGIAASWLHRRDVLAALGVGLIAGIGLGDGLDGLLFLSSTTSPVYWSLVCAGSVALVVVVCARRLASARLRGVAVAGTAVVTAVFVGTIAIVF